MAEGKYFSSMFTAGWSTCTNSLCVATKLRSHLICSKLQHKYFSRMNGRHMRKTPTIHKNLWFLDPPPLAESTRLSKLQTCWHTTHMDPNNISKMQFIFSELNVLDDWLIRVESKNKLCMFHNSILLSAGIGT